MALFGEAFTFVEGLDENVGKAMPAWVKDELLGAVLQMPAAYTCIRSPVHHEIIATDATPSQGGSCKASVPLRLGRALFKRTEFKGEAGRLDWGLVDEALAPCGMAPPSSEVDTIVLGLPWAKPHPFGLG